MQKITSTLLLSFLIHSICMSSNKLMPILSQRSSGYAYDTTKIVTQEQLNSLMKAAQQAPSCYNDQPWCFIICDKSTNPEAYNKALSSLVEFNQQWAVNAPVLVICVASSNSHRGQFNAWAQYDTGAAAFSMMIQATAMGLMAHQMGGFDGAKITELFGIPHDYVPLSVMAIGYSATKEVKVKERKPLNENFFFGSWGTSR